MCGALFDLPPPPPARSLRGLQPSGPVAQFPASGTVQIARDSAWVGLAVGCPSTKHSRVRSSPELRMSHTGGLPAGRCGGTFGGVSEGCAEPLHTKETKTISNTKKQVLGTINQQDTNTAFASSLSFIPEFCPLSPNPCLNLSHHHSFE